MGMYGQLNSDRFMVLADTFAVAGRRDDERPGIGEWAERAGVSRKFFTRAYPSRRSPELLKSAIEAAASIRGLDADRLTRWLCGGADADLEALLRLEIRKMKCTGAGPHAQSAAGLPDGWFDPAVDAEALVVALRRCKMCSRLVTREKRNNVAITEWEREVFANSTKFSSKLRQAIEVIKQASRAPTTKNLSEASGLSQPEVRQELKQLGLEKPHRGRFRPWLIFVILRGVLASNAESADYAFALTDAPNNSTCRARRRKRSWGVWLLPVETSTGEAGYLVVLTWGALRPSVLSPRRERTSTHDIEARAPRCALRRPAPRGRPRRCPADRPAAGWLPLVDLEAPCLREVAA